MAQSHQIKFFFQRIWTFWLWRCITKLCFASIPEVLVIARLQIMFFASVSGHVCNGYRTKPYSSQAYHDMLFKCDHVIFPCILTCWLWHCHIRPCSLSKYLGMFVKGAVTPDHVLPVYVMFVMVQLHLIIWQRIWTCCLWRAIRHQILFFTGVSWRTAYDNVTPFHVPCQNICTSWI